MRSWWVVAWLGVVPGCTTLFGLESPVRVSDAAVDDAPLGDDGAVSDAPADAMSDALANVCPDTYGHAFGTSKYRHSTTSRPFDNSAADCADDGPTTHLAVITTPTELTHVLTLVSADARIGLTDRVTEGAYLWVTTEDAGGYPPATGTPWDTNEPDASSNRNCVVVTQTGWRVISCGVNRQYLCECDAYANDPTRY